MNIDFTEIIDKVLKFDSEIQYVVANLSGKSISKKLADAVENYRGSKRYFDEVFSGKGSERDFIKLIETAKSHVGAIFMVSHTAKSPEQIREGLVDEIHNFIKELDGLELYQLADESIEPDKNFNRRNRILAELSLNERMPELNGEHRKIIERCVSKVANLELYVERLEESVIAELDKSRDIYNNALDEFSKNKQDIDKLLGVISGTAVAGSYEQSAKNEIRSADFLRAASVVLMCFVVILVAMSFYDINSGLATLESAIFKIGLIFLVSVPAAYLARESSRHRMMYYEYIQRALDLRAFDPYIASLPNEEQSRLKSEMTVGFFSKNNAKKELETYPINIHELLVELIKRTDRK